MRRGRGGSTPEKKDREGQGVSKSREEMYWKAITSKFMSGERAKWSGARRGEVSRKHALVCVAACRRVCLVEVKEDEEGRRVTTMPMWEPKDE